MKRILLSGAVFLLALPGVADASPFERVARGGSSGFTWEARSLIVGQTSTAVVPPGDLIYLPSRPGKDGLAFLEIGFGSAGTGFCSGSLMAGGAAILTAAHCVTDNFGNIAATGGFAYFYNGSADPLYDLDFGFTPGIERVALGSVHVAPGYTGEVIDHNDLAIIFLAGAAPSFAVQYLLAALADPTDIIFNVAGFGNRGTSGAAGAAGGSFGRLREGDNMFEYALGNPLFGNAWALTLGDPLSRIADSWVSDFDRVGFAANDTSCLVTTSHPNFVGLGLGNTFCDTGLGPREVGVAGGDSGGPQFVDGRIVSVTSYGLTFGPAFGDFGGGLNSGWGEFSGYAPVFRNRAWIESLVPGAFGDNGVIPEPGTWAMLIAGFGLVGVAARRRRIERAA
ncbi:MAG: PEPxxWA-CTERM sorting domain-containing protein [Sphingomonadaceae bacterium]